MSSRFTKSRTIQPLTNRVDPGPFLARVVSHLDNQFMGSLKVQLLKTMEANAPVDKDDTLLIAHYASPFYGVTSWRANGDNDNYQNTQQSYGMWFVPPDVDTKVLVMFVEGRRDICYWFACVPDDYMNFMIPDGRASTVLTTPGSRPAGSEGRRLPVGEYNKRTLNPQGNPQPTSYVKPVNTDFVDRLTEQGLLEDDFRGLTSSSARREVPSSVFGINTPGPLDKRPGAPVTARGPRTAQANVFSSRLGGHSIVMDDGDDKILRKTAASDGPPEYIEVETAGNSGIPEGAEVRPANELFRIRTRTGHQILLHNTEDLIYISNARGTAWIELTSNGKIDIYAQDSVSIHTEGEFNLTADSNINLTSGADINLNATGNIKNTGRNIDSTAGGRIALKAADEFSALAGDFIALKSSADFGVTAGSGNVNITGQGGVEINSPGDLNLISDGAGVKIAAGTNFEANAGTQIALGAPQIHDASEQRFIDSTTVNIMAWSDMYITGQASVDLYTTALKLEGGGSIDVKSTGAITTSTAGTIKLKSAGAFDVGSSNLSVSAGSLEHTGIGKFGSSLYADKVWAPNAELNSLKVNSTSGGAAAVSPTYVLNDPGDAADAAPSTEATSPSVPTKTDPPEPSTPDTAAVASRVPQHEPWFQHENLNPSLYSSIRAEGESTDSFVSPFPDTFLQIGRNTVNATLVSAQTGTAGPNSGINLDEPEEDSIGTINFNNYTENAQAIIAFFEANGFEDWHGAGIAGALQVESGTTIEPGAYLAPNTRSQGLVNISGNGGFGARGICQWRNAGNRLVNVERFLGKSLLQQPETDPNSPRYYLSPSDDRFFPTEGYRSMPFNDGDIRVKVAPANTTLEEQLSAMLWELDNSENAAKRALLSVNSGSPVQRAREVAGIMHDLFLRSDNRSIAGRSVKDGRKDAAQEIYEAYISGRSTDPITDPNEFPPAPGAEGADPAANSRPRNGADPADLSTGSNAASIVTGSANSRRGALRPNFLSALNRAARDAGIHRIQGFSFGGEPLRRLNSSTTLPIANWGTFPSRADGPGADMRGSGNSWRRLNPANGEFEFRSSGASWRVGTERHDTGMAIDCYLIVNGRTLLPTNAADRNKISEFLTAFARYGGRGVGVGSNGSSAMRNGAFHLDMLGGVIVDRNRFVRPRGFSGDPVIGWNQRPSAWSYGGASSGWALDALNRGFSSGGIMV